MTSCCLLQRTYQALIKGHSGADGSSMFITTSIDCPTPHCPGHSHLLQIRTCLISLTAYNAKTLSCGHPREDMRAVKHVQQSFWRLSRKSKKSTSMNERQRLGSRKPDPSAVSTYGLLIHRAKVGWAQTHFAVPTNPESSLAFRLAFSSRS